MSRYYTSRKFMLTIAVLILAAVAPYVYKQIGVSDNVVLMVLGIFAGIGTAYGFLNVKEKGNDSK